ncbi:hypothetical protein [Reinekea thalattae]|uniref:C-type cytochrome biogenesis protein CcmI n=1 Tax=Reinekea thalattae TaxID=2593301 RepID=A0A5C8Z2B3_9GAMM|nr:hypothetical protein [Reinekea thalattae]TXR51444.1 hypothetical protein FME95_13040 [Reinekea thalattae]
MSFISIGIIMLTIVLIQYLRTFSRRRPVKPSKSEIDAIIEKVAVFEALAKDAEALNYLEKELKQHPNNQKLTAKKQALLARMSDQQG